MVGFCHLTDSHHYHYGQKPTMVGICHGGNMPVGQKIDTAYIDNSNLHSENSNDIGVLRY